MKRIFLLLFSVGIVLVNWASSSNPKANKFYNEAKEKAEDMMRLEAKDLYTKAIQADPEFAEAYYERALLFKHFKENDKAIRDFENCARYESAVRLPAYFEAGKLKLKDENYKGAIETFDQVLKIDETNEEAHLLKGQALIKLEEYKSAYTEFESILTKNPKNNDALFYKGFCLAMFEDYANAILVFDKVIAADERYTDAFFYRAYSEYELVVEAGETHHVKDHLHKAEADYTKAINLEPTLEEAYFDRGEVRMELHDYVGAISDFKKAIEIKPNDLEAHYQKAMCNYHYGYEEQAYKEFQSILEMDSTYANAHYMIGVYLYEIQEFDAAEEEFTRLMKLEDEHADAHYYRGLARIELGIYEGACEDLNRAAEMGTKVEKTVFRAARCDNKHE